MKRNLPLFVLFVFISVFQINYAQEKKPKVVLVLSGGGAKGVAHVPLLQALDSLHIVPDLIVGNSMGSIMGGLYAMGYSGDSIAKITKTIDWDKLLGGSMSLQNVGVEEKSEFQRYLAGIGIKDGKPTNLTSILNDQNLREYLSELTYPVYNVKDFDNLSIPFKAMATDVVNGKEVILDKGSLAFAMRASMSLPAVFKPMPYEGTLLVDGGVMNNFPTDVAKQLGADIIIGSDVGGGMEPIDKLESFVTILMQTSMFPSNIKNPENRKNCTILVDHLPNLRFSTADFAESNEIYKDGKIATAQNLPALAELAKKLQGFQQRKHELPKMANEFFVDTIIYKGISKENIPLVLARTNIKPKSQYTTKDLIKGINRAMGTNLFHQITYSYFTTEENKIGLQFNGFEYSKNLFNASLHYDTYRGVGIILNYTGRNILAPSSRLLVTADIAEQPKARINFQKSLGSKKDWWWSSELYGAFLNQELFLNGKSADNMLYNSFEFNNEINRNLNPLKSYVGLGFNYNYTSVKPKNDPILNPNVLSLDNYDFDDIEVNAHYAYNDMDKVFFATDGNIIRAAISRSLFTDANVFFTDPNLKDYTGQTSDFTRAGFGYETRLQLKRKITCILGFDANFMFEDQHRGEEVSFSQYGYAAKYFLGGILPSSGNNRFSFPGLNDDELAVSQFMAIKLGAQINPMGKIYITPHFNLATVGYQNFEEYIKHAFSPKGNWDHATETSLLLSSGAAISYQSILGPIHFDTSWVNNIHKARLFFSVGFSFNP